MLEANGFAHAYSTWISQGNGLDTKRDGVFRYKAGPMKGMTRDQAQMFFQNTIWRNATPKQKDEYAKRATSDLLAPSEQSDLEKRKAFAGGMTQPQYKQGSSISEQWNAKPQEAAAPMQNDGMATRPVAITPQGPPAPAVTPPMMKSPVAAPKNSKELPGNYVLPGDDSKIMAGPPSANQSKIITDARYSREPVTPANDFTTLTPEQKAQRTQANIDRMKEKASSMGMPEEMPAMSVTAPRMKPVETKYDMAKGRVVQTGGDADKAFTKYNRAQNAANAGTATAKQRKTVTDYVGQDVLGRQPEQIAKQREDERKGYYQAGRYVGPPRGTAQAMPVQRPIFTGRQPMGASPARVATRQPSSGNLAGTGATRMPF
jgi:hypothetical protein